MSPVVAGAICCTISVLGYSAANVCLRQLAALGCDPAWVTCNKEVVTVVILGGWLLGQAFRGLPTFPTGRPLLFLILAGLATQLGGNVLMQWAFGIVGLAVMIPAMYAFNLTFTAIFGRILLGERVATRSMGALGMFLASLAMLAWGAYVSSSAGPAKHSLLVTASIGAACLAGIIYAMLGITIRHCVTGTTRLTAVAVLITGMGVVTLGPLCIYRYGLWQLLATPPEQLAWMAAAGLFNMIAFLALIQGLQLVAVIYVNMLNATQVALAVVAGMTLFGEPVNGWLLLGIVLTICGTLMVGPPLDHQAADQHI